MLVALFLALCSQAIAFPDIDYSIYLTPITTQTADLEYYGLYSPTSTYGWYNYWFLVDGEVKAFSAIAGNNNQKRQQRWWPELSWGNVVITNGTEISFHSEKVYPTVGFDNNNNETISLLFDTFTTFPYDAEKGIIYDIWLDQSNKQLLKATFEVKTGSWSAKLLAGDLSNYYLQALAGFVYEGDMYVVGVAQSGPRPSDPLDYVLRVYKDDTWKDIWRTTISSGIASAFYDQDTGDIYGTIVNYYASGEPSYLLVSNVASSSPPKKVTLPLPKPGAVLIYVFLYQGYLLTFWVEKENPRPTFFTLYDRQTKTHKIFDIPAPRPGCNSLQPIGYLQISPSEFWVTLYGNCPPNFPSSSGHDEKLFVQQIKTK